MPVTLPQRVTPELCNMLKKHHPLFINLQFNNPLEITEETKKACSMLDVYKRQALKALVEAKEQGLIKHIGITGHIRELLIEAIDNYEFETLQFPFNPVEPQGTELLLKALKKGMGTIAMKPMAGGTFSYPLLSLKYIMNSGLITVAIPGMDTIEQVIENARVGIDGEPLTKEEEEIINKEVEILGTEFCRRCGYCCLLYTSNYHCFSTLLQKLIHKFYGFSATCQQFYPQIHKFF